MALASPGRPTEFYTTVAAPHNSQDVEHYIKNNTRTLLTPAQETSKIIAQALHKQFNLTVDPDTTYIVTTNYDTSKPTPRYGKILNKISLTHAALSNMRALNTKDDTPNADSDIELALPELKKLFQLTHSLNHLQLYRAIRQTLYPAPAFEYVVHGTPHAKPATPDLSSSVPLTPQQFRDLVWNTPLVAPYKTYLDNFWAANEHRYKQLSKIAFAQAAYTQTQEGSLSEEDARLVMRATGLPPGKPWLETHVANLQAAYANDPSLEVGLLSVTGNTSSDLMYVIDKQPRRDTNGQKIHTTLLHIPGNSSPIHRFDSPEAMKTWVADQAADPVKRAALVTHFKKNDQDDKFFFDGVAHSLKGLGGWTASQTPNALGFTSFSAWDPQRYITLEAVAGDPFQTITQRQKERAYADADHDITTDGDVTKAAVLKLAETATAAALMMTPLAFVMPEVGLALDVIYVGAGLTEAGIGIDDLTHGKSSGTDRIVFGVLNAAPGIAGAASKLSKGVESLDAPIPAETAREIETPTPQDTPEAANRLRPGESSNISAYAVADSEQLIGRAPGNAKNIYQLTDANHIDRWFIRYTDSTAVERTYEIKANFKLSDDYVEIIDPVSRKPVMTVHSTAHGDWVQNNGAGGISLPWGRNGPSAKRQLQDAIDNINKDKRVLSPEERERALDEMTRLIRASKAENYASIEEYTEAGSDEINSELRSPKDPSKYSSNTQGFLADLDAQADYSGKGYRYAFVTSQGADTLKTGVGKVFRDAGVQSASTQPFNAKEWETWAKKTLPSQNRQPVIYVFDESIPKKNLSTDTLPDHIAVEPNTSLEVRAAKERDGVLYVYLDAPTKTPKLRYNLFDGTVARPF